MSCFSSAPRKAVISFLENRRLQRRGPRTAQHTPGSHCSAASPASEAGWDGTGGRASRTRSWLYIPTPPPLPSTRSKRAGLSEATQLLGAALNSLAPHIWMWKGMGSVGWGSLLGPVNMRMSDSGLRCSSCAPGTSLRSGQGLCPLPRRLCGRGPC